MFKYIFTTLLLIFTVSLFAADDVTFDGWDIVTVQTASADITELIMVAERMPCVIGEDHTHATLADGKTKPIPTKSIGTEVGTKAAVMLAWEVGWQSSPKPLYLEF